MQTTHAELARSCGVPQAPRIRTRQPSGEPPQNEAALARRAQAGDTAARTQLINAGIPLVTAIARRYYSPHLEQDDLVQEGILGLCEAIDHFEDDRGADFATYAPYWSRTPLPGPPQHTARLVQ